MRILITEFKRMFYEKKLIGLLLGTIAYVTICSLFFNLRFRLDYGYVEASYEQSGFKLWQDNISEVYVTMLMQIIPTMIYIFSFMDDMKNGIDNQICIRNKSNTYYTMKYITVISGGMIYNFLSVILLYFPINYLLSTGDYKINYLDRESALVGNFFKGNTAFEFIIIIALCYAFVGGICAAMSFVISIWTDNRVLVCIMPYIIFRLLRAILKKENMSVLVKIIVGDVDVCMTDKPFIYSVYFFIWWILLVSILYVISYTVRIERKR